jgi:hypothetical protein
LSSPVLLFRSSLFLLHPLLLHGPASLLRHVRANWSQTLKTQHQSAVPPGAPHTLLLSNSHFTIQVSVTHYGLNSVEADLVCLAQGLSGFDMKSSKPCWGRFTPDEVTV